MYILGVAYLDVVVVDTVPGVACLDAVVLDAVAMLDEYQYVVTLVYFLYFHYVVVGFVCLVYAVNHLL